MTGKQNLVLEISEGGIKITKENNNQSTLPGTSKQFRELCSKVLTEQIGLGFAEPVLYISPITQDGKVIAFLMTDSYEGRKAPATWGVPKEIVVEIYPSLKEENFL